MPNFTVRFKEPGEVQPVGYTTGNHPPTQPKRLQNNINSSKSIFIKSIIGVWFKTLHCNYRMFIDSMFEMFQCTDV